MSIKDEMVTYGNAKPTDLGEVEIFDTIIFPNVIRKKELDVIFNLINRLNPERILDYGCGAGWLSKILISNNYNVLGVDICKELIEKSKEINSNNEFFVGDCLNLPFKENKFDLIIGMGIIHHLDCSKALLECHRILKKGGYILFMEPNVLNPPMYLGRKLLPSEIHTMDEKAINPNFIKNKCINCGFTVESINYLFPFSFCISYLFAKTNCRLAKSIANMGCNSIRNLGGRGENHLSHPAVFSRHQHIERAIHIGLVGGDGIVH